MRRQGTYRLSGAVLVLIWTAYYYAKRSTGGLVDARDRLVCGAGRRPAVYRDRDSLARAVCANPQVGTLTLWRHERPPSLAIGRETAAFYGMRAHLSAWLPARVMRR